MTQPVLVPEVTVVVHPVDTAVHPTYPEGWRWAVMVGGRGPADLDYCAGAGMCSTEPESSVVGEQAGSTAVKALRMLGIPARYSYLRLGYDPIPAEADERPIGVWRGEDDEPTDGNRIGQQVAAALRPFVQRGDDGPATSPAIGG